MSFHQGCESSRVEGEEEEEEEEEQVELQILGGSALHDPGVDIGIPIPESRDKLETPIVEMNCVKGWQ